MVLRDVKRSGGGFVAVSDDDLRGAMRTLASQGGILAEPAGAAAFAGAEQAVARGLIRREEKVVVLVTGTAMKNLGRLGLPGRRSRFRPASTMCAV